MDRKTSNLANATLALRGEHPIWMAEVPGSILTRVNGFFLYDFIIHLPDIEIIQAKGRCCLLLPFSD